MARSRPTYLLSILLATTALGLSAQQATRTTAQPPLQATVAQGEPCGFDALHQHLMQTDQRYHDNTLAFDQLAAAQGGVFTRSITTYKIPVVVHVMETGTDLTNITDEQIRNGIRALNERFRKVAGTAGAGSGVDVGIEFVLAVRDPSGNCTTGITRTNMTGNATYMASGVFRGSIGLAESTLKALDVWDQTRYYNIWAVSEIDGNDGGNGTHGFAYFSSSHGTALDGCVLLAKDLRDPTTTTLTHELGHSLNVYHTFEGDNNGASCPPNATCGTQGDLVCDTPPHIRSVSNCNSGGTNSCDGNSSNSLFVFNYMDYSSCGNAFTSGQAARMVLALTTTRASFLAANGNLSLVPPGAPIMDITPSTNVLCGTGSSVTLYSTATCIPNTWLSDSEFPSISWSWTFSNGVNTYNSTVQNPTFTPASAGVYNASVTVTTALGSTSYTENGVVVVAAAAPTAGCTPTSANPSANYGVTVSRVRFNTFDNLTSEGVNGVYQNYACTKNTVVQRNGSYPLNITVNGSTTNGTENFEVYIDYNNNGVFDNPSELVGSGSSATPGGLYSTTVTIPATAIQNTMLRMRVIGDIGIQASDRNCSADLLVADVEDYGVYVSSTMAAVSIAASPGTTITYGTNVTFTPTPTNGGGAPTYQWFRNGAQVATSSTYASNNLLPGDQVYCRMFSNLANVTASPATSNTLTMAVTGPPLSDFKASVTQLCSGSTVSFTDLSQLSPTGWSWSFPGGSPGTSTAQNPTVTYSAAGTYSVTLTASNGLGTGTTLTRTAYITVYSVPPAGCTITRANTPLGEVGIQKVTLNTIGNTTAFDDAVMMNFTCGQITTLDANTTYGIGVQVSSINDQWVRVYIDYNRDGDFVDSGELIFSPANGKDLRSGTFTTPANPVSGQLMRMRVISDFVNTFPAPCTTPLDYGQVEEYGIVFNAVPNTAPVLNAAASPALAAVLEDAPAPAGAVGTLVSALVDLVTPSGQLDNVTDPDAGALTGMAIIGADATNGTWHYSINGGTNWIALGTPTATVSRLLAADAGTRLYFQPNANYNGSITSAITFRAWDRTSGTNGGTADASVNGGTTAFSTATDVASIVVTAVNDAPTATNLSAAETYTEDVPLNLIDIVAADIDNTAITATLTLSLPSAGSLSTGTSGAVTSTYVAGTGVWTASGAIANVNTLLAGVTFTPAANFNSTFTISTSVSDGQAQVTGSKTMSGIAVNDAPTATNLSAGETYTEDVALNLIDIVASDVDNATVTATLTLSNTAAGSLSTGTSGAVTSTYSAGTGVWIASGAIANVNTLLAGVTFTPAANFNGTFTIATSVSDGVAPALTGSKSFTAIPVNDAPVINAPGAQSTNANTALVFAAGNGNLISMTDVDVAAATVHVSMGVSNGTLTLYSLFGISFLVGDGTADQVMEFVGSLTAVNTALAPLTYQPNTNYAGADQLLIDLDDMGNTGAGGTLTDSRIVNINVVANTIQVSVKAMLEGPYVSASSLMNDALRGLVTFPTAQPYGAAPWNYGGAESVSPAVLAVSGTNAVVDWVLVELRSGGDNTVVLARAAGLIQRDGDVVATDGTSPLTFNLGPGAYYVVLRHRNHLGVMTSGPVSLSPAPTVVDLRQSATTTYGLNARKDVGGVQVLWMGDVTADGLIKYTGGGNDRDPILTRLGGAPTLPLGGYYAEDCTLDGVVKYTGTGNDRDPILLNIGGSVPTATRAAQLP